MNWAGLIKCIIVIAIILAVYLIWMNTGIKEKYKEYPFLPLGIILIVLCVIGLIARFVLGI